jgi:Trypsin-like peptidase domain
MSRRGKIARQLVALRAAAKTCIRESAACVLIALFFAPNAAIATDGFAGLLDRVNVIDGADGRDSLLAIGPRLGLSAAEMARIRKVSGYVGCLAPSPAVGSGALFLSNRQILTAAHIFFEASGRQRWKCFFKNQDSPPVMVDLLLDKGNARFGATPPKSGSNDDYAVVRLAEPIAGGEPFPIAAEPPRSGDPLILVSAHPAGMDKAMDNGVPVVQACKIRRVPKSSAATSFYRTDCDATGAASGSMNLGRVRGQLVYRGIVITTGPWRDPRLVGAPYDETTGSVTTALGTDAAIVKAGRELSASAP